MRKITVKDKKQEARVEARAFLGGADSIIAALREQQFRTLIENLPGKKVPDRTDFVTFIDDQETRIKNWRKAVDLSAPLGEDFLELVESGKLKDVVEKL